MCNDVISFLSKTHTHTKLPKTKYLFYKMFHHNNFDKHYYCPKCSHYYGPNIHTNDATCECDSTEDECGLEYAVQKEHFFFYWSIKSQLLMLLGDNELKPHLLANKRKTNSEGKICDIIDGDIFNSLPHHHTRGQPDTVISMLWNFDGVPIFKSSTKDMWPIQCSLNQIPALKRREHIMIPAIWLFNYPVIMKVLVC